VKSFQRVLELPRPFKIALILLLVLILSVLLFPWQTTVVPTWELVVVEDDSGQAVAGINVTQHWQHYLLETEGHEERQITNNSGQVSFHERTIRASLLRRILVRLRKVGKSGVAGRTDPYASIVVWGSRDHQVQTAVYPQQGSPPDEVIVTRLVRR